MVRISIFQFWVYGCIAKAWATSGSVPQDASCLDAGTCAPEDKKAHSMLQSKKHAINVHSAGSDGKDTCKTYCATHKAPWKSKCKWGSGDCAGCADCTSAPAPKPPAGLVCKDYCATHQAAWKSKCKWGNGDCAGCADCTSAPVLPPSTDTEPDPADCPSLVSTANCDNPAWKNGNWCAKECQQLRPHVVFMMIDDMGFNDFVRSEELPWTKSQPLLSNSLLVNTTYTECLCSPSRSSFMVGRYLYQQGWAYNKWGRFSSQTEVTVAQKMNVQGYVSYAVGKWHLGKETFEMTPSGRGFARSLSMYSNGDHYQYCRYNPESQGYLTNSEYKYERFDLNYEETTEFECPGASPNTPAHRFESKYIGQYSTNVLHATAIQFLQEHKAKYSGENWRPLFMYYAPYSFHVPLQANKSDYDPCPAEKFKHWKKDQYKRQTICAMAVGLDKSLSAVAAEMGKLFADDNYLLFVSSDNGGKKPFSDNYPLRNGKSSLNEGGIRNNVLIWGQHPELEAVKGSTYTGGFMHLNDWHMTIAHLGHATPSEAWNPDGLSSVLTDGVNIWEALISNGKSPRNDIGLVTSYGGWTYRKGAYKVVFGPFGKDSGKPGGFADAQEKDIPAKKECSKKARADKVRLYNMDEDPQELCDLATSQKALADSMVAELKAKTKADEATKTYGEDSLLIFEGMCPTEPPASAKCQSWCNGNKEDWTKKCSWGTCNGCDACWPDSPTGSCADAPFMECCKDLFGLNDDRVKDFYAELGPLVKNNQCNNEHTPSAAGKVFAQKPHWEILSNGATVKKPIDCPESSI